MSPRKVRKENERERADGVSLSLCLCGSCIHTYMDVLRLTADRIRKINAAFVEKPEFSADLAVFLKSAVKWVSLWTLRMTSLVCCAKCGSYVGIFCSVGGLLRREAVSVAIQSCSCCFRAHTAKRAITRTRPSTICMPRTQPSLPTRSSNGPRMDTRASTTSTWLAPYCSTLHIVCFRVGPSFQLRAHDDDGFVCVV